MPFLCLFLVGFRFPETRPLNTDSTGPLYRWSRYKPVIGDPHFMFYASCCMIAMASILCYVSYSPVWLIGHLGISELTFSGLFGLNAAVNIAACFAAPVLVKRIGNRPGVVVALSLMLIAAVIEAAMYFAGPQEGLAAAIAFMAPMMILCIGFAILLGPATSMALSAFGERRRYRDGDVRLHSNEWGINTDGVDPANRYTCTLCDSGCDGGL